MRLFAHRRRAGVALEHVPRRWKQQELAAATPTQRNWRGILIALLVIAAVLGLIVFSIALLTPAGDGGRVRGRRPTLGEVLAEHYRPFNGTWLSGEWESRSKRRLCGERLKL
ncbi:unnamed protein product, partial [Iphiclides podalirius]